MKTAIPIIGLIVWVSLLGSVSAETIYKWVDRNGVKQFSTEPPPAGIENYEQIESTQQSTGNQNKHQQRRNGYDAMVDESKREAQQSRQERLSKERDRKDAQRRTEQRDLDIRVKAEKKRLKQLVQKAKNRGLSKTYSQGMRQSKVDKIQEQLDLLNKSPQTYFDKIANDSE